ncbi:hypothetical protein [Pedobacter zeae]|uniref:Ig-like domain-containing protein n=1 Tax=Pedobacter zeae TaxID=1737356 RepID=A0A7W6KBX9_9SPHI|nr:hypothetical protein [Pedobacter zeae]MBB4107870.1 hypothetical protein [Pedobacter zeae]GGG96474.1 hypothetical protein GCM10007422_07890 [Pedobacter zeae]
MTKKITKNCLRILAFLLFLLPISAFAQTPNVYLCGTGTVKLTPAFSGYTPVAGDKIIWTVDGTAQSPVTYATAADAIFNVPATLTAGTHTYSVQVIPADANLCPSDASDNTIVEKLPPPAITVSAPGSVYCTDQTATTVITASKDAALTLPAGVSLVYTWTATKGGVAVSDPTTLGTVSGTNNELFTLKTGVAPEAYVFTAEGKYAVGSTPIVPSTSCTATGSKAITVTVKPGKAVISVAP